MIKICFVCSGNTCRSIMAERLLKKQLKENKIEGVKVLSRGLHCNGENISEQAKAVLKEFKASASNRKSVKLSKIDKDALYIVMDERMKGYVKSKKLISIKDLIGNDIPDPYGGTLEQYRRVALDLKQANMKLIEKILEWRHI